MRSPMGSRRRKQRRLIRDLDQVSYAGGKRSRLFDFEDAFDFGCDSAWQGIGAQSASRTDT